MTKDPAFLFYTSDFLTGTVFMTNEQVGIYIRLLSAQHQHGGLIDRASFLSAVGNHEIVRKKFIETEDGFYNKRLMDEMDKRSHKSDSLSANAKIRWQKEKQKKCKSNAIASDLHMPIEDVNEDIRNVRNVIILIEDRFKEIWGRYPKKDGSKAAKRSFMATVKSDDDWARINIALNNYLKSDTVKKGFIKNGSTWFNNWQDWVDFQNRSTDPDADVK